MDYSRIRAWLIPRFWARQFRALRLRVTLPLAMLAAAALIGINEISYQRSLDAIEAVGHAQRARAILNTLLQEMLDAETSQRGYLLTGDTQYLQPYEVATHEITRNLRTLRELSADRLAEQGLIDELSAFITRKQAELDLTVSLRKQGNEDAWKFVVMTNVGLEQMNTIRLRVNRLVEEYSRRIDEGQAEVTRTLLLSRIAIALVTLAGLMAFYRYLQQAAVLRATTEREQASLQRERDQLERLVIERTERLGALASHLQHVREEERGHLARELHDEMGSLLTAAKLDVTRLRSKFGGTNPEVAERLQHLTTTLNSGIALSRRIIEDLRPSSLTNLGLHASLEILTREFEERTGIGVTLDQEPAELPQATQLTIYRLIQESLTNVSKYANAKNVTVNLQVYSNHVTVDVADDGQGFSPRDVRPNAHGLVGMRHRVEVAGGRFTIVSEPGRGTRIAALLPKGRSDVSQAA